MAKKEFKYRGKSIQEIKGMSIKDFMQIIPARQRRTLKRGFTEQEKKLLERVKNNEDNIKTHCRDIIITPIMIDKTMLIYNGKTFQKITIVPEMIGHRLGEFALTRSRVTHSSPGVGATKSSSSVSVR